MPLIVLFFFSGKRTDKQAKRNGQRCFFESKANQISINEKIRMMKKLQIAFVDEEKWS
jgi:hypothetical protein